MTRCQPSDTIITFWVENQTSLVLLPRSREPQSQRDLRDLHPSCYDGETEAWEESNLPKSHGGPVAELRLGWGALGRALSMVADAVGK